MSQAAYGFWRGAIAQSINQASLAGRLGLSPLIATQFGRLAAMAAPAVTRGEGKLKVP
jgi:hypothetical protein